MLPFIVTADNAIKRLILSLSHSPERMYIIGLKIRRLLESQPWLTLWLFFLYKQLFSFTEYRMHDRFKQELYGSYSLYSVHSGIISIPPLRAKRLWHSFGLTHGLSVCLWHAYHLSRLEYTASFDILTEPTHLSPISCNCKLYNDLISYRKWVKEM